jgi:hypothetical protein
MKEIKQYPWVKPDTMRFHERYERVKEGMGLTEVLALLGDPDEKDEIGSDGIPLYWDRGFAISYILEKPERDTDLGEGDATLWFTPSGKLEKKEIFSDSEYEYLKSHRSTASIPNGVSHPAPKKILKSRASAFKEIR